MRDSRSRPSVFISHSAHEHEARIALDELVAHLESRFTVLADSVRLRGGDVWEDELRFWLDSCRGGIVLISPSALTSDWVHTEASVLCQRRRRPQHFPLVPLLVAGATREAFAGSSLQSTGLVALQAEPCDLGVVDRVMAPLLQSAEPSPTIDLERRLEAELDAMKPDVLVDIGHRLGLDLDTAPHELHPTRSLAIGLITAQQAAQIEACLRIARLAGADLAERVYGLVSPHGWVTAEVAEMLRAFARGGAPRLIGVRTVNHDTCDMHVRCGDFEWRLHPVRAGGTEDAVSDFLQELSSRVAASLGYEEDEPVTLPELNAELEHDPRFVLLPLPAPSNEELEAAAAALPNLVVLMRCPDADEPPGLHVLRPPIEPDRELELLRRHKRMRRSLKTLQASRT